MIPSRLFTVPMFELLLIPPPRTSKLIHQVGRIISPPPSLNRKESDEVMDENGELQTRFYQLPLVYTSDLIGRTFLTEQDDGQKHRARIVAAIEEHDATVENNLD
jgi:hypothetical protein